MRWVIFGGLAWIVGFNVLTAPPLYASDASENSRGTPRATIQGFLDACGEGDFYRASEYLDLSGKPNLSKNEAARLARRLRLVLDRTTWIPLERFSDTPEGSVEKGFDPQQELLTELDIKGRRVALTLTRTGTGATTRWLLDRPTVESIDPLYAHYGLGWVGDHLPVFLLTVQFAHLWLWQWLALLSLLMVGWPLAKIGSRLGYLLVRRLTAKTSVTWDDKLVEALNGPLTLALWALFLFVCSAALGLSEGAQKATGATWKLIAILGLGWLVSRMVTLGAQISQQRAAHIANKPALQFMPFLAKVGQVLVWIATFLLMLDAVGVNALGLMAGLSLGGVAIAFAAQKTIENLFGAFAVATDRPFAIGDWVVIGSHTGTVEEIGLRSTRLRTLARTVVTIPNGMLISERVENFASRDRFLYNPTIGVLYGTSQKQLEFLTQNIDAYLRAHPKIHPETIRVRFAAFGASSLDINILAWVVAADFHEYTQVAEEINYKVMALVEEAGTGFAFPSTTIYPAPEDPGLTPKAQALVASKP